MQIMIRDGRLGRQGWRGRVDTRLQEPLPLPWPSRAGAALPCGGLMAVVPGRLPLIEPMLATPVSEVPADEGDWAAEAKRDGSWRMSAAGPSSFAGAVGAT
jgi:hypothetical protein